MKKAVALSTLVCVVAVIFTAIAAALDIASSLFEKTRWPDKPVANLNHERLMHFAPPNSPVIDTYTMILGTLALNAALNKLHQIPQPQITAPPRRQLPR